MKCSNCGKNVTRGYTIYGSIVLCSDCNEVLERIIRRYVNKYLKHKIFGMPLPTIEEHFKECKEELSKLRLTYDFIEHLILTRIMRYETRA